MPLQLPWKLALCQINTVPGDLPGNERRIFQAAQEALRGGARLAIFPELALEGYSPRDLLLREGFLRAAFEARERLARALPELAVLFGTVLPPEPGRRRLFNGAVLLEGGRERGRFTKVLLAEYDVFDEARYFRPGSLAPPFLLDGVRVGVTICEDMWARVEQQEAAAYDQDPVQRLKDLGCDLFVNLSASPYARGRPAFRAALVRETAQRMGCPVALCNLIGGNDEILFDGHSQMVAADGTLLAQGPGFEEAVVLAGPAPSKPGGPKTAAVDSREELRRALVMGLLDYATKCGFKRAHLGLSGGIDSALVASLAVDALGADQVAAMALPSRFSSKESLEDARELASRLGISLQIVAIEKAYKQLQGDALKLVGEGPFGVMEENIQARIRGLLLMAYANRTGSLLLSTGNKSELAVGYCTLYGDMSGGLAVIADLFKTEVYELARLYAQRGLVPERILKKAPSAELRPDQNDQQSLPPYDHLDRILRAHVEQGLNEEDILAREADLPLAEVRATLRMVALNEYKRHQAPPVLRVSLKSFGFGRRVPIVASNLDFLGRGQGEPSSRAPS